MNKTSTGGNSLLEQYQDKYQTGDIISFHLTTIRNNFERSYKYPSNIRKGKSFDTLNIQSDPIKFPSSRKRRHVTQDVISKHNIQKVVYSILNESIILFINKKNLSYKWI